MDTRPSIATLAFTSDRNNQRTKEFVIVGEPQAWKRAHPIYDKGFMFDEQKQLKNTIGIILKSILGKEPMFQGALEATLTFFFSPPKNTSQKKLKDIEGKHMHYRPDSDNLAKLILDSANDILYHDDSQITDLIVHKRYSKEPRTVIVIQEVLLCP